MTAADFKIVDIVCRGDLQGPGSKTFIHIGIGDNRDSSLGQRQVNLLTGQTLIPFVLRIDGHARIPSMVSGRVVATMIAL